jgi:hypothetical protein
MYSFSTAGCPNVTITSLKNMGNVPGNISVDETSGKGECIYNEQTNQDFTTEVPGINRRKLIGYEAEFFDKTMGRTYHVKIDFPLISGDYYRENGVFDDSVLNHNKCFTPIPSGAVIGGSRRRRRSARHRKASRRSRRSYRR